MEELLTPVLTTWLDDNGYLFVPVTPKVKCSKTLKVTSSDIESLTGIKYRSDGFLNDVLVTPIRSNVNFCALERIGGALVRFVAILYLEERFPTDTRAIRSSKLSKLIKASELVSTETLQLSATLFQIERSASNSRNQSLLAFRYLKTLLGLAHYEQGFEATRSALLKLIVPKSPR